MTAATPASERKATSRAAWILILVLWTLSLAALFGVIAARLSQTIFFFAGLLGMAMACVCGSLAARSNENRFVGNALATFLFLAGGLVLYGSFVTRVGEVALRIKSQNNLKQIAIAMLDYESSWGTLPPASIKDERGRPLLSWRVAILPIVEEGNLYRDFHLNEPWDSPHNIALLPRMPRVFASVGQQPPEPHMTFYRVFVGPQTAFERDGLILSKDFPDGRSETILVVEAGEAWPWTKPGDLEFHPEQSLPPLGGILCRRTWLDRQRDKADGFNAAMADGSVRWFKRDITDGSIRWFDRDIDEATLRALITRNGGEKVELP